MIDVCWISYHAETPARGYWDQGIVEHILPAGVRHHVGFHDSSEGAIAIVPARAQATDVDRLNADLARLDWVVLILTGDEERVFPVGEVQHPNMIVWVQTPDPRKDAPLADQFFGCGWPPATREAYAIQRPVKNRDWFFAGQVVHKDREACIQGLSELAGGEVVATDGFTLGLARDRYLYELGRAKVAPAPSGCFTPDTFRLWEALEAGCVPVVSASSSNWGDLGYWRFLLGGSPPFPVLDRWSEFPATLEGLLDDWPAAANRCMAWWIGYKRSLKWALEDDLKELGAR